ILDDLQWVDDATLDALGHLVDSMPAELSLILSWRREHQPTSVALGALTASARGAHVGRLAVEPLGRPAVAALTADLLGATEVSEHLVDLVAAHAGGLPFAIEQMIGLALDAGVILPGGRVLSWPRLEALDVPAAVRDATLEAIGRLGADALRIVEA